MKQYQRELSVPTRGQRLFDITGEAAAVVHEAKVTTGMAQLFCRHTSASLIINENADAQVRHDLEAFLKRLVPTVIRISSIRSRDPTTWPPISKRR